MKLILNLGPSEEMRIRQSPYLQARWHGWEAWDSPLAEEWFSLCNNALLTRLGIAHLRGRHLTQLSSGEFRKARIAMALAVKPEVLILKDPYSGLDPASRDSLKELIANLDGVTVEESEPSKNTFAPTAIPSGPWLDPHAPESIASLSNCSISYDEVHVFTNLNWELKRGQRWRLRGPNGSGKSTLMAMLQGDHPQAYSNTLSLFGRARGSGESIWDIKARIGCMSPELHAHFPGNLILRDTILSGFFESLGLFKMPSAQQQLMADTWLAALGMLPMAEEPFDRLNLGQQRLALLARALVKRPALLLLDEPCQGLDGAARQLILQWVGQICAAEEGTLVYVSHRDDEVPHGITHTFGLA